MADPYGLNLGDMFSGKGPDYTAVPLDAGTSELIHQNTLSATQTPEQIAARSNAGIQGASGEGLQSDQQLQAHAAATGQNPAMLAAIRNQYGQAAQKGVNSIVKQNEINAPLTKADYLQKAAQMAQAKMNVATQNYEGLTDAYNQNMAARAQVISSVFNVAGAGGGAAMSGQFNKMPGRGQQQNTNAFAGQPGTQSDMNPDWYNA